MPIAQTKKEVHLYRHAPPPFNRLQVSPGVVEYLQKRFDQFLGPLIDCVRT